MSILVKKGTTDERVENRRAVGSGIATIYACIYKGDTVYVCACRRVGGTIKRTSRRIIQCAWYVEVQYERETERERDKNRGGVYVCE